MLKCRSGVCVSVCEYNMWQACGWDFCQAVDSYICVLWVDVTQDASGSAARNNTESITRHERFRVINVATHVC